MLAKHFNREVFHDAEARYNLDLFLVHCIDKGYTLCSHPSADEINEHSIDLAHIESSRHSVFHMMAGLSPPPLDVESLRGLTVFDAFHNTAAYTDFKRQKPYGDDLRAAEDVFHTHIEEIWCVDWNRLGDFPKKSYEYFATYYYLHLRYQAYVAILHGTEAVPIREIIFDPPWDEDWPDETACIAYELAMEARMPYEMQLLERVFLPERVLRRHDLPRHQSDSTWTTVDDDSALKDRMVQCVRSLDNIPEDVKESIAAYLPTLQIEECDGTYRYSHFLFRRDTLVALMRTRGVQFEWSTHAPSPDICILYFLHAYNISPDHWPSFLDFF